MSLLCPPLQQFNWQQIKLYCTSLIHEGSRWLQTSWVVFTFLFLLFQPLQQFDWQLFPVWCSSRFNMSLKRVKCLGSHCTYLACLRWMIFFSYYERSRRVEDSLSHFKQFAIKKGLVQRHQNLGTWRNNNSQSQCNRPLKPFLRVVFWRISIFVASLWLSDLIDSHFPCLLKSGYKRIRIWA